MKGSGNETLRKRGANALSFFPSFLLSFHLSFDVFVEENGKHKAGNDNT